MLLTAFAILIFTSSLTLASAPGNDSASPGAMAVAAPFRDAASTFDTRLSPTMNAPGIVAAADPINPYYSEEIITLSDGGQLVQARINGPAQPPPGHELDRAPVTPSALARPGVASSLAVPAYNWVFGCSAVSAAMIGAYFDRNGLPGIYTGPANGGVMPMDNSIWPTWVDGTGETYSGNPLVASRQGLDGRSSKGSIDDYWVAVDSTAPDPYISGGWTQHTWGDAYGDYMKTSQSAYDNPDGSTRFSWWLNGSRYTCAQMEGRGDASRDGSYGRKLFYEARGYNVRPEDCYNQLTNNQNSSGFTFADYKAQIDAGYPVLLNLKGHSVVGVGYADPSTVYIHDTWDSLTHQMTWGGSYAGMELQSVSIVNPVLNNPAPRKVYIPLVLKTSPPPSWTTLVSTDFEGAWPGPWQVADDTGAMDGEYYWGKRSCRSFSGSNSGWAVGAGAQGSALGCGANYPNNAESWMIYGPFDLSGATAAHLTFKLWLNTEPDYDKVCRFASIDGMDFWGTCTTGNTNGWSDKTLDLKNV